MQIGGVALIVHVLVELPLRIAVVPASRSGLLFVMNVIL